MKRIVSINIIFENTETIKFLANEIGVIEIDNIKEKVRRVAVNLIATIKSAEKIHLELLPRANHDFKGLNEMKNTFERIKQYNDITAISVRYDDNTKDTIYIDYNSQLTRRLNLQACRLSGRFLSSKPKLQLIPYSWLTLKP